MFPQISFYCSFIHMFMIGVMARRALIECCPSSKFQDQFAFTAFKINVYLIVKIFMLSGLA